MADGKGHMVPPKRGLRTRLEYIAMKRRILIALSTCLCAGCNTMTIKHEIPPIYATVDVNIRIQRELADFFDFEENRSETETQPHSEARKGDRT
jgi:hypothetical protein